MKKHYLRGLLLCGLMAHILNATAGETEFSFAVIQRPYDGVQDESVLRQSIAETDAENLAFVIVNGIKAYAEPCSDNLYNARKALFNSAKNGIIVSPAGSDWTECKSANQRPAAMGRLNRIRELFFADEMSMGRSRIPMVRQSTVAKFRSFGENSRWEIGDVMFATINLPANNNHYLLEAGRNGEFEDRLLANRDWLNRIFSYATRKKLKGIVLFSDGNPLAKADRTKIRRDGFDEMRQQVTALASKFPGKVLLIHGRTRNPRPASSDAVWRGNLGVLEIDSAWLRIDIDAGNPGLFIMPSALREATGGVRTAKPAEHARHSALP
jgi:hypothetical protein